MKKVLWGAVLVFSTALFLVHPQDCRAGEDADQGAIALLLRARDEAVASRDGAGFAGTQTETASGTSAEEYLRNSSMLSELLSLQQDPSGAEGRMVGFVRTTCVFFTPMRGEKVQQVFYSIYFFEKSGGLWKVARVVSAR
jgi:hypothetical protein